MPKIKNLIKIIKTFSNWGAYLLDFWTDKRGLLLYKLRNGTRQVIRGGSDDRFILNEIYIHEIYNPPGFEIGNGDIIIDIGGHIGIFSTYAAKLAKNGRVYAFEPTDSNFEIFEKHIKMNELGNIKLEKRAISDKSGIKKFYISNKGGTGGHSFYKEIDKVKDKTEIEVRTVSFAEIIKKNNIKKIDFLKLDCEGAEYAILFNCPKRILNIIDKIAMEYHNMDEKNNVDKLGRFLQENRFKVQINKKEPILYAKKVG